VVLRDIDALDASSQVLLLDWLENHAGGRSIISTASASLLPLVEAGLFDRRLYYRVNTVYIRLDQDPASA
jgi:transcriptional regulator of acetoin/glycerol metabolism